MFAYCLNNPTNYTDKTGNCSDCSLPEGNPDIAHLIKMFLERFREVEEKKKNADEKHFEENTNGGGKLWNSFTTEGLYEIAEESYILVNESEYIDSFHGSHEGVFIEWGCHNVACYIPFVDLDRAMHVDLGYTIFDDPNKGFNCLMWGFYAWIFPEEYQDDWNIYLDHKEGKQ